MYNEFLPSQIKAAYGLTSLPLTAKNNTPDGTGETIAIVDAYDDTRLGNSTSSRFSTSDLHYFDGQYGLPEPTGFFKKVDQAGGTSYPPPDLNSVWEGEESLDVEWVHAIAPGANIILVEASNSNGGGNGVDLTDLGTAARWAATPTSAGGGGANVVLMSWAVDEDEESLIEGAPAEDAYVSNYFTQPANYGVTYVSSTGDDGDADGSKFPASSPAVLAVGGTKLATPETAWGAQGNTVGTGGDTSYWGSPAGLSIYRCPHIHERIQKWPGKCPTSYNRRRILRWGSQHRCIRV